MFSSTKGNAYTDKRGIGNISYSRGLNFYVSSCPAMLFLVTVQKFVGSRPEGLASARTKHTEHR